MSNPDIIIYTDGSSRGNPGPGGYGIVMQKFDSNYIKEFSEGYRKTTNNRMELTAVIEGLAALTQPCQVMLTSDSTYVLKGIQEWMPNWKKRGWKTASKKPVKNVDLWQKLDRVIGEHKIDWRWVKGHSGHRENEIADQLANQGIDEL